MKEFAATWLDLASTWIGTKDVKLFEGLEEDECFSDSGVQVMFDHNTGIAFTIVVGSSGGACQLVQETLAQYEPEEL